MKMSDFSSNNGKKSGYAGLIGFPNSGKSTILNNMTGKNISPVTYYPSTTRVPIAGLFNKQDIQICFIDTPPISLSLDLELINWLDICCFVVDARKLNSQLESKYTDILFEKFNDRPIILLLTFIDYFPPEINSALLNQAALQRNFTSMLSVCPPQKTGIQKIADTVSNRLPDRKEIFPSNCMTLHSERFLVSEQIRTQLYSLLPPEIANSTAVQIEEFSFRDGKTYVRANIHVSRHSSKGVVIGRSGKTLQNIVHQASDSIEELLGKEIFLDLWVKVRESWMDNPHSILEFGYVC